MRLLDCPDAPPAMVPSFAETLSGKPYAELSDEELRRLDTERPSCINRYSKKYRQAYRDAEAELDALLEDVGAAAFAFPASAASA